ncbi:MAG: sigma-70 family RNA polymerase sigma factor [Planctomycetota bacterium]|jgi:RNA polymerase sigma-70 factor (ECF subfamily)
MTDSDETLGLIERLRRGDRGALDPLFARHVPYLRRLVAVRLDPRLRRRLGVSDVVQQAQVDALQRIDQYLADSDQLPFRWWLRRAAHERLHRLERDHLKTARRDVRREVPLPDRSSLLLAGQLATPSELASKRELAAGVRRALARLDGPDREVLLMRAFEHLPYDEIGYVLGIAPAAARQRHGRALLRLERLLREDGFQESGT